VIGRLLGFAQALPFLGQQFVHTRGDTTEDVSEPGFRSTSLRRAGVMRVSMMAARSAPRWEPAKVQ